MADKAEINAATSAILNHLHRSGAKVFTKTAYDVRTNEPRGIVLAILDDAETLAAVLAGLKETTDRLGLKGVHL